MFESHIDQMANPADSIFDGFPRTPEQAEDLWAILQAKGVPLEAIIVLRVSRAVCSGRLRGRLEQEHREDDASVAAVERRLDDYERYTVPAYQKLAELSGLPIIEVDGELPEDQVTTQILSRLREQGVRAQGFEDAA
jgi:adenylate kinase